MVAPPQNGNGSRARSISVIGPPEYSEKRSRRQEDRAARIARRQGGKQIEITPLGRSGRPDLCTDITSRDCAVVLEPLPKRPRLPGVILARLLKLPKVAWPFSDIGSGPIGGACGRRGQAKITVGACAGPFPGKSPPRSLSLTMVPVGQQVIHCRSARSCPRNRST